MTAYRMSQYMVVLGGDGSFEVLPSFLRIGFGRYQWQLFILSGLGWMADSKNEYSFALSPPRSHPIKDLWLQGLAVVLPQVQQELLPVRAEFATLALYIGLVLGATTWGSLADLIGRRVSFNVSIFCATGSVSSFSCLNHCYSWVLT